MSLEHQDFKIITLSKNSKNVQKNILSGINNVDLHKIKIENETENFKIPKTLFKRSWSSYGYFKKPADWRVFLVEVESRDA